MTRLLVAAVFATALATFGHAQTQTIVISGRVVSAESGDALPHARVVIYNDATPLPALFTDGNGQFASSPLAPGRYRLTARKSGYAPATVAAIDARDGAIDIRMSRAAAISGRIVDRFGEPAAGVMISLLGSRPGNPPPVTGTTAAELARSSAAIFNGALKRVTTDDQGEYRFGGLAAGTYFVMATVPQAVTPAQNNFIPPTLTYFPGVETSAQAQPIELHPGDDRNGVDLAGIETQVTQFTQLSQIVPPTNIVGIGADGKCCTPPKPIIGNGVIRGRVTQIDGFPIAHASVSTRAPQTFGGANTSVGVRVVHTDEDGRYEFTDLPAGRYRITAAKLGFTSTVYGQRPDETTSIRNQPTGTQIDLAQGQTKTRIDISMPRYSAVTGRVLDDYGDPVEGIAVDIAEIQFQAGRRRLVGVAGIDSRSTDDLGRYRLYGILPGQYIVSASPGQVAPNELPSDLSGYAPTYFPGTPNAREAQFVPVPRAQDVNAIDFALVPTPTASISGMKIGSDGEPMGGSLMLMESQRSGAIITPPAGARIKDDGHFEFPNVAPGEYVIQADRGRFNGNVEGDFAWQYVTVNGGPVTDVLLRSTPGSTISGHVVFDGDGPPPAARDLAIVPERADLDRTPNQGSIARADVQADLSFQIAGVHGPRRIGIPDRLLNGWGLKAVIANGVDVTDRPIAFGSSDQSLSDVQVILTNRLPGVFATAVNSRGEATREYTLIVFPDDRERWYAGARQFRRARPEPQGYATVEGLPAGEYHVVALANGGVLRNGFDAWQDPEFLESIIQDTTPVTLTEGSKASVSLKVITR